MSFEILKNSLISIAEEMGVVLRKSSFSPNIKERRDFSCALFTATGQLAAQAEHIPVHLGAMPYSVQAVLKEFEDDLSDGDDVILHFVSADGTKLEAAGSTPLQPLQMDWVALSITAEASGGFRALFYEQAPSGSNKQGVVVLRSPDGSAWERVAGEAMPLSITDFDGTPVALAAMSREHGLLAWFVVRDGRGGESIRIAFHKETS